MGSIQTKCNQHSDDNVEDVIEENILLTAQLNKAKSTLTETKREYDRLSNINYELKSKIDSQFIKFNEEIYELKKINERNKGYKSNDLQRPYSALLEILAINAQMQDIDDELKTATNLNYERIEGKIQLLIYKLDVIDHEHNPDAEKYRKNGIAYAKKLSKYVKEIISQQNNNYTTYYSDANFASINCFLDESLAERNLDQVLDEGLTAIYPKLEEMRLRIVNFRGKSEDNEYRSIDDDLMKCLLDIDRMKSADQEQKKAAIKMAKYYMSELDKKVGRK